MGNVKDPQSIVGAHSLGYRMGLLAIWLLTGKRPAELRDPVYFEDEGVARENGGYRGTLNMRWMAYVHAWVYHLLAGDLTSAKLASYRDRLLRVVRKQLEPGDDKWCGLMGHEQCSPIPHDMFYAGPSAVTYLAALLWKDKEMAEAFKRWWAAYLRIADECHTTTGEVVVPCVNARVSPPKVPKQPLWSAIYREHENATQRLKRRPDRWPHDKKTAGKVASVYVDEDGDGIKDDIVESRVLALIRRDDYNLALWLGLIMRERGLPSLLDVTPAACMPVLHYGLEVKRVGNVYTARIPAANLPDVFKTWKKRWVASSVTVVGDSYTVNKEG